MGKTMLVHMPSRFEQSEGRGMTLLEALLAMMMLVVFTGIVALVMQFTLRFSLLPNQVSRMSSRFPMGC